MPKPFTIQPFKDLIHAPKNTRKHRGQTTPRRKHPAGVPYIDFQPPVISAARFKKLEDTAVSDNGHRSLVKNVLHRMALIHEHGAHCEDFQRNHFTEALQRIFKVLNEALVKFGYHAISGARYACAGYFEARNHPSKIVASANQDPLLKHINMTKYRNCAEEGVRNFIDKETNEKLRTMVLFRKPELLDNGQVRKYSSTQLLPCSSCNKRSIKKLYDAHGTLVVIATEKNLQQVIKEGGFLEKPCGPSMLVHSLGKVMNEQELAYVEIGPEHMRPEKGKVASNYNLKSDSPGGRIKAGH